MYQSPSLRLALGLGDQELEQRLRPSLESAEDLQVVAQCLAADQLLQVVSSGAVDAVVLAWSLHRLTDTLLEELERRGLTLVLLAADPDEERWRHRACPVLSINAEPETIRQAVLAARPGLRYTPRPAPRPERVVLKPADSRDVERGGVIAVCGGAGSPGRTTVAINIATALGAVVPTVLVELDLCAPSFAAYLDADPSRNICTLAHAVREDPRVWGPALDEELQPLGSSQSQGLLLCGPPKREMRASVGPAFVERLLEELTQRFRWVVLDVGPELLGLEVSAASHRAGLARAQHVVVVSAGDFVSIWHARTALDQIEQLVGIDRRRLQLVLNRHDPRFHYARQDVEWHLGAPVVAVVPLDHAALQRAIGEQRPVVLDPSSRAGRAMVRLAEALHEGKVSLPLPGARVTRQYWWQRLARRPRQKTVTRRLVRVDEPAAAAGASTTRMRAW